MVMMSADPPAETSGSGTPITGARPMTTAMLTSAWPMIQHRIAPVVICTNGSGCRRMIRIMANASSPNSAEHEQRADQAELLAEDREDEVVVGGRQVGPLLAALPQAEPAPAAARQPAAAVQRLVARRRRRRTRSDSQLEMRAVRLSLVDGQQRGQPAGEQRREPEHPQRHARRRTARRRRAGGAPCAVPRSWPASTTPSAIPATGTAGISACRHCRSSGSLRASTAPSHTASASLIASDGCAEMPPMRTQFWLPPTPQPSGREHQELEQRSPRRAPATRTRWKTRTGIRDRTNRIGRPMQRELRLVEEHGVRRAVRRRATRRSSSTGP